MIKKTAPPRVLVNYDKKLAIYWSPKAGCSTVAKIFLSFIGEYDNNNVSVIKQRNAYAQKLIKKYCRDGQRPQITDICKLCNYGSEFYSDYIKLQVVRNPYTRVVASFLKYLEISIPIQVTFEQYLLQIKDNPLFEHHMLQQFMTEQLDDILYLENLESDLNKINSKYNLSLKYMTHVAESYTKFQDNNIEQYCGDKLFGFTQQHVPYCLVNGKRTNGIPGYSFFYNEHTKNLVTDIYNKDINYFKYQYPY